LATRLGSHFRLHAFEVRLCAGPFSRQCVFKLAAHLGGRFSLRAFDVGLRAGAFGGHCFVKLALRLGSRFGPRASAFGGHRFVQLTTRVGRGFLCCLLGLETHARRFGEHLPLGGGAGCGDLGLETCAPFRAHFIELGKPSLLSVGLDLLTRVRDCVLMRFRHATEVRFELGL
jgi:hypothetical protein